VRVTGLVNEKVTATEVISKGFISDRHLAGHAEREMHSVKKIN
jgi:hypothetical protein